MKTKTVNASELTCKALDWAAGVAVGREVNIGRDMAHKAALYIQSSGYLQEEWSPTTSWAQIGPLIGEYKIDLNNTLGGGVNARCMLVLGGGCFHHDEIGVAACRAIVAAKLGDTVDVPEVLL